MFYDEGRFYAGDVFDRGAVTANYCSTSDSTWSAQGLDSHTEITALNNCGGTSVLSSRLDSLENSVDALNKVFMNVKLSSENVGAALKSITDKLNNCGKKSLRSQLKTLGGTGRYV